MVTGLVERMDDGQGWRKEEQRRCERRGAKRKQRVRGRGKEDVNTEGCEQSVSPKAEDIFGHNGRGQGYLAVPKQNPSSLSLWNAGSARPCGGVFGPLQPVLSGTYGVRSTEY